MAQPALWFGIGAGVFFVAVLGYLWFASTRGSLRSAYYFLPPIHATVAGVAYVGMTLVALGTLPSSIPVEGLPELATITLFRHADWVVSTPIITYYLAMLAGIDRTTRVGAILMNVLVIALGFLAATFSGRIGWAFFAGASVFFLGLLYVYLSTLGTAVRENPGSSRGLFMSLRDLTVTVWSLYPLVFVLGPSGLGVLDLASYHFVFVVLDLTAKVGFMVVMLTRQYALNTFISAETTAAPE